ncbi:MAG: M24 family metallopeptidase [Nitriliruptorales bacterium]|nr:M24 family metallopeptidase [Nitriliruptorales bacterium]
MMQSFALPDEHRGLTSAPYPRFSAGEMARRRRALAAVAEEVGVDRVLVYGADRSGSAVQWLTGWPVTREAAVAWGPDEQDSMFVEFANHVPLARELAPDADVQWGRQHPVEAAADELERRGGRSQRVGIIGPLRAQAHAALAARCGEVRSLGSAYTSLRLRKSSEEVAWLRIGAALSDAAITALDENLRSGLTEHEVVDLIERAYVPRGGSTHIHYVGVTSMAEPSRAVPAQYPSTRQVRAGDVLVTEISAAFWGYAGQVLRTFTVEAEPTPLYQQLHDVAEAAFDRVAERLRPGVAPEELVDAAGVIEDAGFTVIDDLVHGYGGGYLPPVLGSRSRPAGPLPDLRLEAGMTVVVQPNVVTPDGRAGVQTGELLLITDAGPQRLHRAAAGLHRVERS